MKCTPFSLRHACRCLVLFALSAASVWACSVPVFRYALEHWEADPFQAVVFHEGPLSPDQQTYLKALAPAADEAARANVSVIPVDVTSDLTPDLKALWTSLPKNSPLPRVAVRFPRATGINEPFLTAPLADAASLHLTDSPARQEIVDRLSQGENAVWILLESGDAAQDDATAKLLEERLEYLMGVLTLPELDAQDIANGLISVKQNELRLDFTLLRISRQDAKEKTFIQMLLATEDGLADLTEPVVFPVFGRGRALYALVGKGIRAETIDEAATFLIGKCSCQVKDQNPGADLLLTADWKAMAKASPLLERDLPSLAHLAEAAAPVTVVTTAEPPVIATAKTTIIVTPTLLTILAALSALAGAAVLLRKKGR